MASVAHAIRIALASVETLVFARLKLDLVGQGCSAYSQQDEVRIPPAHGRRER